VSTDSDDGAPEESGAPAAPDTPEAAAGGGDLAAGALGAGVAALLTSNLDLSKSPAYPDDGRVSRRARAIDNRLGQIEQVLLVALLAIVVLTAAGHALLDRFVEFRLEFKDQVVRAGTFALAMFGAAFATYQARHLSMDLVSRRLSPRARLFLKVILALFTIAIVAVLVRSGLHLAAREKHEEQLLSTHRIAFLIPIGGALIILHTILHTIIDVDYILRRKTPPERMRSAH
jgi:TRAP-type C4-dicarboxylate transport system permease small subunit